MYPLLSPAGCPMLSTPAKPAECGAGINVGDSSSRRPLSLRWPQEFRVPGLFLGAAVTKKAGPSLGRRKERSASPATRSWCPASYKVRAVARSPQLQPPEKQSRHYGRQGPCPLRRPARVSARPAASRPGFEEPGGQLGAGRAWAGRPSSGGRDSVPRRSARPEEICATWDRGPRDNLEMS